MTVIDTSGIVVNYRRGDNWIHLQVANGDVFQVEAKPGLSVTYEFGRRYRITNVEQQIVGDVELLVPTADTTIEDITSETDELHLIVTGDTHIGYNERTISDRHDTYSDYDCFRGFHRLVNYAVQDGEIDAILHAGDLFDSDNPDSAYVQWVRDRLQMLTAHDIGFGFVRGNHDPQEERAPLEDLEGVVHLGDGTVRTWGTFSIVGYDAADLACINNLDRRIMEEASLVLAHPENGAQDPARWSPTPLSPCCVFSGHNHEPKSHKVTKTFEIHRPGTPSGLLYDYDRVVARTTIRDSVVLNVDLINL